MTGTKLKTKAKAPPETRRLGYARLSTYGHTLDAQLEQLRAEGVRQDLPREGNRRASRPARAAQAS